MGFSSHLAPRPPPNVYARAAGLTIHLVWDAAESPLPVTGYCIYRRDPGTEAIVVGETRAARREFFLDIPGIAAGRYSVTAVNPAGESLRSTEIALDTYARMA